MTESKKFVRSSIAAVVALGLAAVPAQADEIEAEEVIVGEEIVAPPAEPCPECDVNNGSVQFAIGNDITNAYFFRGILQEKNGFIWQPWGNVTFNLYEAADESEVLSNVSLMLGTWNSVHTAQTRTPQTSSLRDGVGPGNWYESDVQAGLGVGLNNGLGAGVSYIAYMSPNDAFGTVQEIDVDVSYDDSALYGGGLRDLGFNISPYLLWAFEIDKTRFGKDEGIYMEIGAEPSVTVMGNTDYPVTIGVPLTVGLSLDNYYLPNDNPDGSNPGDDVFGYASAGLGLAVPLAFIPARLGEFSAGVSGQWLALGSNLQRVNTGITKNPAEGRFGEWIGVASLNWQY